jgi:hypothetical protein
MSLALHPKNVLHERNKDDCDFEEKKSEQFKQAMYDEDLPAALSRLEQHKFKLLADSTQWANRIFGPSNEYLELEPAAETIGRQFEKNR